MLDLSDDPNGFLEPSFRSNLKPVEAWVGVIGALAGALAAILGQHMLGRSDRRNTFRQEVLTQCAQVAALSEDYRNRIWEERTLGAVDVVAQWDIPTYKLAEARLRILNPSPELTTSLLELGKTGRQLGNAWRPADQDTAEVDIAWRAHKDALDRFLSIAAQVDGKNR